jgi:hypothetical protein
MPRSFRLVLAVLGCLFVMLLSAPVVSAATDSAPLRPVAAAQLGDNSQADSSHADRAPAVQKVAPPGPNIPKQEQEADRQVAQNKAIIGAVAAVLLVIIYFGRRSRNKYRRKVKNLQNAKS